MMSGSSEGPLFVEWNGKKTITHYILLTRAFAVVSCHPRDVFTRHHGQVSRDESLPVSDSLTLSLTMLNARFNAGIEM
jgi:hypothetical protein